MQPTPISLLKRITQDSDPGAWVPFVRLYTPLLSAWARDTGLDEAEAADLVQDVFTVLVEKLPTFRYDPRGSFRGWLRAILVNRWRALKRKRRPTLVDQLDHVPDDTEPPFSDEAVERVRLLRRAVTMVQAEIAPTTWEVFHQNVLLGKPAAQVANDLKVTVNSVYIAKSRVLQRLRQLVEGLLE
jgi:RNA polymerase sigma-70 factor (ECF subfamily)